MPHPFEFILFAQHGWADNGCAMAALAAQLNGDGSALVIAPSLNYLQTWLRMTPLVKAVETLAQDTLNAYPQVPFRVIGHSMGGLIWLEVLARHQDWWSRLESITLVASPIGGADLGRIIDPFGIGIGIAADLGKDRRPLATSIASVRPTLVIVGDIDDGSDGTISVESTKIPQAQFLILEGLAHPQLRNHPQVVEGIQRFWAGNPISAPLEEPDYVHWLRSQPYMTDAHRRAFPRSKIFATLTDGNTLRVWTNAFGVLHVYVASPQGLCLYAGFTGWMHSHALRRALAAIETHANSPTR